MSYTTILVTEEDGVRRITLNRPERRNAMTPEMLDELIAAMEEAAKNDCRVVVFAGRGGGVLCGVGFDRAASDEREDGDGAYRGRAEDCAAVSNAV